MFDMNKPLIAAINGLAIGFGATMTLPMDIRIAADCASFGFIFTRLGLVPEAASSWFLPRLVGIGRAQEWMCSGRTVGAADALDANLVRSLHPVSEVLSEAVALAREIAAATAPISVALTRRLLWRMQGAADPTEASRIESRLMFLRGSSADAFEGVQAVRDKRAPKFPMQLGDVVLNSRPATITELLDPSAE
jgi:enoyl-CoA hydratase/carnithine racemase